MNTDLFFAYGIKDAERIIAKEDIAGGVLLCGQQGLGKHKLARLMAQELLSSSNLEGHPDFLEISSCKGVIRTEELEPLRTAVKLHPSNASRRVIIIDDANLMTPTAANSLLKILEDTDTKTYVILLVLHGEILPTIESRCMRVQLFPACANDISAYLKRKGLTVNELALALSDGCIGTYFSLCERRDYLIDIRNFFSVYSSHCFSEMLISLSLMKEKDSNNFMDKYEITDVIRFIKLVGEVLCELTVRHHCPLRTNYNSFFNFEEAMKCFSVESCLKCSSIINKHIERSKRKGAYSRNDFFDLIRSI